MFGSIRDKLFSPQPDLFISGTTDDKLGINLNAGAILLERYQNDWMVIHNLNEENAKKSEEVDKTIGKLKEFCDKQWTMMTSLVSQLSMLPTIAEDIKNIMKKIGTLENSFEEVDKSLLTLENTIEIQQLQEKQLDQRFKLALYKEKKLASFEVFKDQLSAQHASKLERFEAQHQVAQKERQQTFNEAFQEEMQHYKMHGRIERVVSVRSNDGNMKLEDVELEQEVDALDAFLATEVTEDTKFTPEEEVSHQSSSD